MVQERTTRTMSIHPLVCKYDIRNRTTFYHVDRIASVGINQTLCEFVAPSFRLCQHRHRWRYSSCSYTLPALCVSSEVATSHNGLGTCCLLNHYTVHLWRVSKFSEHDRHITRYIVSACSGHTGQRWLDRCCSTDSQRSWKCQSDSSHRFGR